MSDVFVIRKDHLKLLKRMFVGWQDCETGAPAINPKRPYGNSDVEYDIVEILGWRPDGGHENCDVGEYHYKVIERAQKIHREMELVLQICLCTQSFEEGTYVKQDKYDGTSWTKFLRSEEEKGCSEK